MTNLEINNKNNKFDNATAVLRGENVILFVSNDEIEDLVIIEFDDFMQQVNAMQDLDWNDDYVFVEIHNDRYRLTHDDFIDSHIEESTLFEIFLNNVIEENAAVALAA